MNNEFLEKKLALEVEDWKYAIMLVINEFLLNARLIGYKLEILIGDYNLDKITIPTNILSHSQKVYDFIKSYILSELYLPGRLPLNCNKGYELYESFINFNDIIFLTQWEHLVWRGSHNIQGFLLNAESMYLLKYEDVVSPIVTLFKVKGENVSIVGAYSTLEDPNILVRKMIFSIYENGFENVEDCPSITL